MNQPAQFMIDHALRVAALSPCRSKRGVALFNMATGAFRGHGFNGPPALLGCPGRERCAGTCGQRSVHAEVRALRDAETWRRHHEPGPFDLIHVELGADGGVVACDGPSCWQCAREVLDVGFVGGVWLYERVYVEVTGLGTSAPESFGARWRRYAAEEFYCVTLERCGMVP